MKNEFKYFLGQNIHDIRKSCLKDAKNIDILEKTLIWGHIIPTAPETIRLFNFKIVNIFIFLVVIPSQMKILLLLNKVLMFILLEI